ncbi:SusC/RagA family TonB-linked outer membrane protein [Pedobacter nutrimenti]|jgi:TonB-linked SusC/RagA family outer membrane protein|uniref:TonB-linked SusC/RagA family outer membrane protein n=1 Tax=Pedobacter nutrimenti TaxID=1241337 RepID=A0A318UM15_9SPHI|nr:SusC/RagA family TonB-linked outer membrane protein [Pedobacter nutrimenti]PYF77033.1 TonB-linked SusC/RagA family outer membrane protein [Pedobacter nutrimenti]
MKKLVLNLFLLFILPVFVFAQERTINGNVKAREDGLPIPGASVKVKELPTIGTTTRADGKFTLKVPSGAKTLIISFLGYTSREVDIRSSNVVEVVISSDAQSLNEVVVTGVGAATEKRKVAIDVAAVGNKDFAKSANLSVSQALTGQIAGAQIIQASSRPGTGAQIILRGYTNLGSTNPLILIDGVQVGSDMLDVLDPSTVDRVELVKGSAGGMLYGANGGNGVIQVFTKKGTRNGKLIIDVVSRYSRDKVLQKNPLVASMHHFDTDAAGNILDSEGKIVSADSHGIWSSPQEGPYATDVKIQNNKPYKLPVYNHIDQGYRVANTFTNSVNIRGGDANLDYALNASNLAQQDVFSNNYNRTNLSMNLGFSPAKGLTIRNSTQFIYTHENLLSGSRFNLVNSYPFINFNYIDPSTGLRVVKPSVDIDGNNSLTERDYRTRYTNTPRLVENFGVNYKFPKYLELDAKYSLDYSVSDGFDMYKNQLSSYQAVSWGPANGQITNSYTNFKSQYLIGSAFIRTDFKNDFNIDLPIKTITQVSYDARKISRRYYFAQGTGLTPYPPYNINTAATKTAGDGFDYETLMYGFLVNQTIEYANLLGVSGGFRSDYSSAFGGQSKAFTFPRATVYFNPSELFSTRNLVSNWKVRGAYGEAGVQPGAYDRQLILDVAAIGPTGSSLSNQTTARNPNLQVQVTKELELGTDITFTPLKGQWFSQFVFSGTYWDRKSKNIIQNAPVAPSSGFLSTVDNLVSLKSHGIDLSLDMSGYKAENFTWDLGLRFATSKTFIDKISNNLPIYSGAFALIPGQQLGIFWGQTPLRSVDQLKPDGSRYIPVSDVGNYTLVDGNVVDIRTNRAVISASNDLTNIGNSNPDFTSSIFNRFTIFKKLSVAVQFDWVKGQSVYNSTRQWLYRDRLSKDFDRPVTINGQTGAFVNYYDSYYNTLNPVSWFVEDASFLRLRDASISYDLTGVVNKRWLRTLSVTVSGHNLLTFTKYKGLDPESTGSVDSQGGALNGIGSFRGVDRYMQPNVRSYQFSLNIGF